MTTSLDLPGATAKTIAVEGVRFHLYRGGPARKRRTTPTLLLHGVPQTAMCWSGLVPALASDRVVLAPDLKGLGQSEAREPYDVATLVAELAALVLHEVDGPVDVVGHDWGGSLALGLAGARPDLVRRLVVIAAPYRHVDMRAAWHIPLLALPVLPEIAFRLGGERIVRAMFARAYRAEGGPALLEHYVESYATPDRVAAMLGYYRGSVRPRLRAMAGRLVGAGASANGDGEGDGDGRPQVAVERSLVIWGTADPAMPLPVGESVVRDLGANATMLTLPGVGHWPVEEAADVVVPAITDFLRAT